MQNLIVIDNFLNLEEIETVDEHLNEKPWGLVDDLGEATGRYKSVGHSKEINSSEDFDEFEIYLKEKIEYLTNNFDSLSNNYNIFTIYYNAIRYGDKFNYHVDGSGPSFLIYGNKNWDKSWKSHTLFRDGNFKKKVLPKPGRIVIFDGQLNHRASSPSSHFEESARFSIVFQTNLT
jgi:hypothetical protein